MNTYISLTNNHESQRSKIVSVPSVSRSRLLCTLYCTFPWFLRVQALAFSFLPQHLPETSTRFII
ncbi:hypothetical protein HanRHA438_Chr06g0261841 [Helianthus annuus]|nr:hypothetical protein HanRHA438_Chr06g0261841 [Helianthus annuus]